MIARWLGVWGIAVAVLVGTCPRLAWAEPPSDREARAPSSVPWPDGESADLGLQPRGKDDPALPAAPSQVSAPDIPDMGATEDGEAPQDSQSSVPPPTVDRSPPITVGVGLAPSAPGSKRERALLDQLEASVLASDRVSSVRRLRAGTGEPRRVCNQRRDDLVIMIGYVADRSEPVVLAHDCLLDEALALRSVQAVDEVGLIPDLWAEHETMVAKGVRERRRWARLGPGARAGIAAGIAVVVIGVAVGVLVANTLRDERVVLTVKP